ncbi:MAG: hypothetical protein PHS97_03970 [Oscillospiraceae bacterium]|nr:hypothetical protein [Oscillospiraceae bacterium]
MKFSKWVVVGLLSFAAVFTAVMVALFCRYRVVPDTLITAVFAFLGGEAGVLGLIRHADARYRSDDPGASRKEQANEGKTDLP